MILFQLPSNVFRFEFLLKSVQMLAFPEGKVLVHLYHIVKLFFGLSFCSSLHIYYNISIRNQ